MNKTQKENLAKYFYDVSKLFLAGFVIANILSGKISVILIVSGIIATVFFLLAGNHITKNE